MNKTSAIAFTALLSVSAADAASAAGPQVLACMPAYRAWAESFSATYIDVYNSHDISRFDEVMAPGALNHNPFGTMTRPELEATMLGFYAAFPDLQYQLVQVVIDEHKLVVEYTYTGTHLGNLLGLPGTGTQVQGRGLEVHMLENGVITETFNYSDVFGLFAQLGLI